MHHGFVTENILVAQRSCNGPQRCQTQHQEHVADAGGQKGFHRGLAGRIFGVPETDQQVGAQTHDLPANKQGQQVVAHNQQIHREGEKTDQCEKARVHRFDRHDFVTAVRTFDRRAVRRQAGHVVIALRLAKIMVANTVQEDHQNRPGDEEQRHRGKRVNLHADLQPGIGGWQPVDGRTDRMLAEAFNADRPEEHHHAGQERKPGPAQSNGGAQPVAAVGAQHDHRECHQRRKGDEPKEELCIHRM